MSACLIRLPVLGAAVLLALPLAAADPPAVPLPKGAKLRLGTTRMRDPVQWTGASLTPDGKYLVAFAPNGLTKFDVTTGEPAGRIGPKTSTGGGRVEVTPDGARVLTVAFNSTAVWEAESGRPLAELKRPVSSPELGAAVSADGKVLALGGVIDFKAKDKPVTAVVWDVEKNEQRTEVKPLQNQAVSVALSPDGKLLATWGTHAAPTAPKPGAADPNRLAQFWDAATGKELATVAADGYGVPLVTFTPGGLAVVSFGSGTLRVIDPRTGAVVRRVFGRYDQGGRVTFSPDGKTMATAGTDGAVQLWGVADGARLGVTECPVGPLGTSTRGVRFTAIDRAVAWANVGPTAVVWEVPSGKLLSPVGGHAGALSSVVFAAGGKEVLTGAEDGLLLRWDAATGKELGDVRLRGGMANYTNVRFPMRTVQVAADGKLAVLGRGSAGVYDLATGQQTAAPLSGVNAEALSRLLDDGRTLVTVPNAPVPPAPPPTALRLGVWDVGTGARLAELEAPLGELAAVAVTPDRKRLVTAVSTRAPGPGGKSELLVTGWDLAGGKKLGDLPLSGGYGMVYLTAAPDNATVLVSSFDGKLLAVDAAAGKVVREFDTSRQRPNAPPVFSPDGKQFAAAFGAGFGPAPLGHARVYDWESGKPAGTFRGHVGSVTCLAFSPDGKTLATGGADTTVLLWDVTAGEKK